ncbi:hypothetical protein BKA70DRAFT_1423662 [Coprinopsis sp. MPI-PUGE-AT-0042]|nr:hypothetical protein BKA70DRAFT_1423662 [Coprinopsis sp. MPI-PUGE-AT-0042]
MSFTFRMLEIDGHIITTTLTNIHSFSKNDLIIYVSSPVNDLVVLKWPCINGKRVLPRNLVSHLRKLGIAWGCYCCFSGTFRSCRIGFDGCAYRAMCASPEPARAGCNFSYRIYANTHLVHNYPLLEPGAPPIELANEYAIKSFLDARALVQPDDALAEHPPRPLLVNDWLGEQRKGVKQLRFHRMSLFRLGWKYWNRLKDWLASMEVGVDGV